MPLAWSNAPAARRRPALVQAQGLDARRAAMPCAWPVCWSKAMHYAVGLEPQSGALAGVRRWARRTCRITKVAVAGSRAVVQIHGLVLRWALLRARPGQRQNRAKTAPAPIRAGRLHSDSQSLIATPMPIATVAARDCLPDPAFEHGAGANGKRM